MTKKRVISGIVLILLWIGFSIAFTGCNKNIVDVNNTFSYGYILLPSGECIEGKVQSWTDFEDGDQLQVKINGKMYLTDTTRCVLVR